MIHLDDSVSQSLNQGMNLGGGVELPFVAPVIWTINGDPKLRQLGGAQYYGGWATKAEDLEEAMFQNKLDAPGGFVQAAITTSDGTEFDAYTARHVIVAPIGLREAWVNTDSGLRSQEYVPGARHHVQALVMLASKVGETYNPWGPAVLSAKGFQAKNLLNAFGAWNKLTASLRRKIAPNVVAWCFYLAIGTFGQERKQIMVGKTSQSPITPVAAYLPNDLTEERLAALFVGNETAGSMAYLLSEAQEWLAAWKEPSADQFSQPQNGAGPEYIPEPPPPAEDFPF